MYSVHGLPSSYAELDRYALGKSKRLAHRTWVVPYGDRYAIRYIGSTIAVFKADGATLYTLSGWDTVTTRLRINGLMGDRGSLYRHRGVTYLRYWSGGDIERIPVLAYATILFNDTGRFVGFSSYGQMADW